VNLATSPFKFLAWQLVGRILPPGLKIVKLLFRQLSSILQCSWSLTYYSKASYAYYRELIHRTWTFCDVPFLNYRLSQDVRPRQITMWWPRDLGLQVLNRYIALNMDVIITKFEDYIEIVLRAVIIARKLIKIDAYCQIFGSDSSFWQCKVCGDIRTGSLRERRG